MIAADTGYGAPPGGAEGFGDGPGGFPSYTRNARELDAEGDIANIDELIDNEDELE